MHEKAENERREMEAQMLIFMMNRSARILQKSYFFNISLKLLSSIFAIFFYLADTGEQWFRSERRRRANEAKRNRNLILVCDSI